MYDVVLRQYLKYDGTDGHPRTADLIEFARNRLHINNEDILHQLREDEKRVMTTDLFQTNGDCVLC